MRRLINGILWLIGLAVVLGVYFFVPVGRYTLFEHTLRIAATEPARELGDDLAQTSEELGEAAIREWDEREAIREEAAGELHIDPDPDGRYRLGDEHLELDELRDRIETARQETDELRAILEGTDDAPEGAVARLTQLLEEQRVAIETN